MQLLWVLLVQSLRRLWTSCQLVLAEDSSGLPFPPPRDLPDPRIEPMSLASPALVGKVFTTAQSGKPSLEIIPEQFFFFLSL